MKKWWTIALVLALLVFGGYWFVTIPATAVPNGSESIARFKPGPYPVTGESFSAVDESRTMVAYKEYPGSPVRSLQGEIWRPENLEQPGPLLIYSHGFMSFRQEGLYLVNFLASHGYTVVAVDYPLTGIHAPDGPLATDVVNQPGDISFLIDTLLQRNNNPEDILHGSIDPNRIAVAGVSLGGLTTTLATFHRDLKDPRIIASISIAGPSSMFTEAFFGNSKIPYLMVYSDEDAIVSYENNAIALHNKYPGSILVTLRDASHAGFAQPSSTLMRFIKNPDGIGCSTVIEEIGADISAEDGDFLSLLGGAENGIDPNASMEFCTSPLIPVAMKAARQHMFTTLAAHAFLESVFADDTDTRNAASQFLLRTMPAENSKELSVSL